MIPMTGNSDKRSGGPKLNGVQQHILNEIEWQKTHDPLKGISKEKREETNREWNVSEHHASSHGGLMGRMSLRAHDEGPSWDAPVEFDERAVRLASAAIDECRTSLMMAFRYLDRALWKLPMKTAGISSALASDGTTLYFNPLLVIVRYRQNNNELARDLLHTVLHCVFRHPFPTLRDYPSDWITTCDVIVESIALEMCAGRFACAGDARRAELAESVSRRLGSLVPAKLYRALQRAYDARYIGGADALTKAEAVEMEALFARDDAAPWRLENEVVTDQDDLTDRPDGAPAQEPHDDEAKDSPGTGNERDAGGGQTEAASDQAPNSADEGDQGSPDDGGASATDDAVQPDEAEPDDDAEEEGASEARAAGADGAETAEAEREWGEIAQRMEVDMRTMSHSHGTQAGLFVTNLALANRRRIDYADFLRQFSTVAEDLRIDPDEFDYIFYTYGLELYGNRPLVEPLEYQEHKRVRDFVIALDTSGSCAGELVRTFVTRTFDILKEGELFGDAVNIHIVQCDAQVQSDTVMKSHADLAGYIKDFEVRGLGGTDFRPVFDYVEQLIADGELTDLRGLIYFTDGLGIYPDAPPPYDVAFVFIENEGQPRLVPPWAMKVVLDEDQVRTLRG